MRRSTSIALIAIIAVLLLTSIYGQAWVLPSTVNGIVAAFPETEPLRFASIVWGVVGLFCLQLVALEGLGFVLRASRLGVPAAYRWIRAMIVTLLLFVGVVVAGFVALTSQGYSAPAMLGLIITALLGLMAAGGLALYLGTRMTLPERNREPRSFL